jgi:hypothetical protein
MNDDSAIAEPWPALPFADWRETAATLHMWTQIIGKIRLTQSPWLNHSWHVTLYVTPRGMTTGTIPHGERTFSVDFDFIAHQLRIHTCDGGDESIPLAPQDTADFYQAVMSTLDDLGYPVAINATPNEVEEAIPFPEDRIHKSYDADAANRFWRVLFQADRVFKQFRADFSGKSSPVHFFWGSFDLAVTRFSGREAPDHPGGLPNMPLWVAQASGPVATRFRNPFSTRMPTPRRKASVRHRWRLKARTGWTRWASSCCRSTSYEAPTIRTRSCSNSCAAHSMPRRRSATGISASTGGGISRTASSFSS